MASSATGLIVTVDDTRQLRRASENFPKVKAKIAYELAVFAVKAIKQNVRSNALGIPDKSPSWAKRSKSRRPLIGATRRYLNGIEAVRTSDSAAITGNVLLAKLLEGGTKNMKPRPHIRPSLKKLNESLQSVVGKAFIDELFGG